MSIAERVQYLPQHLDGAFGTEMSLLANLISKEPPGEKLHNKIIRAVILDECIESWKVCVVEPGHRYCFLKEALLDDLVACVFFMKLFDGDYSPGRVDIFGLED